MEYVHNVQGIHNIAQLERYVCVLKITIWIMKDYASILFLLLYNARKLNFIAWKPGNANLVEKDVNSVKNWTCAQDV